MSVGFSSGLSMSFWHIIIIDFLKVFFVIRSTFHIAIVANSLLCQSKLRLICQSGHLRVLPYRNEPEPQRQLGHQLHRRYSH